MRKLLVSCDCGQQIQVPRSAIGRMGMCPTCGLTIRISTSNTSPLPKRRRPAVYASQDFIAGGPDAPEDAKQRFGQAVDLYYAGKYGEALAIFDSLAKQYPGNPDIDRGRAQCIEATQRPALSAPQDRHLLPQSDLDEETVKRVILDKLLNGGSEAIQLQAAELAAKVLGMLGNREAAEDATAAEGEGSDAVSAPEGAGDQDDVPEEVPAEAVANDSEKSSKAPGDEDAVLPAEDRFRAAQ